MKEVRGRSTNWWSQNSHRNAKYSAANRVPKSIHKGGPKNCNYLLEGGPLQYRLPPLGECARNPSAPVRQLALLGEAAFGFSEFF